MKCWALTKAHLFSIKSSPQNFILLDYRIDCAYGVLKIKLKNGNLKNENLFREFEKVK